MTLVIYNGAHPDYADQPSRRCLGYLYGQKIVPVYADNLAAAAAEAIGVLPEPPPLIAGYLREIDAPVSGPTDLGATITALLPSGYVPDTSMSELSEQLVAEYREWVNGYAAVRESVMQQVAAYQRQIDAEKR